MHELDDVVRSTGLLLDQYRSLVERNKKTKFLFGAQKTGANHPLFPFLNQETKNEFTTKLRAAIDRMGINYIWFEDDPEVTLTDPIHTDTKSAEHIAKVYADWINNTNRRYRGNLRQNAIGHVCVRESLLLRHSPSHYHPA